MAEFKGCCCSGMAVFINYFGVEEQQEEPRPPLDLFGEIDPREMPHYFFPGARRIDYSTAVRADITKQNFTVAPRHWYIDVALRCADCGSEFVWKNDEQRDFFETERFPVLSVATLCRRCHNAAHANPMLTGSDNRSVHDKRPG
jgi:hypothetical protein